MWAVQKGQTLGALLGLLVLCSCKTPPPHQPSAIIPASDLPGDVTLNRNAGGWALIFVTLRFENGEEMPFVVDTGASYTVFEKSMAPKLGKRLATISLASWSGDHRAHVYAAPKLYLGDTPLVLSNVITCDFDKLYYPGVGGILGMDCLKHYRIQLDFDTGKMRFLNRAEVNAGELGEAFPLAISSNLPFLQHVSLGWNEQNDSPNRHRLRL